MVIVMKRINQRIGLYLSGLALAVIASCAPSFDDYGSDSVGQSNADFSQFIAIGNSLTAGFADGGLYLEGQQTAFRSEEHTSELQSRENLVCRLLRLPLASLFPYTTLFRSV